MFDIGEDSKTNVCLVYMNNKIEKKLLNEIVIRLHNIKTNNLIMTD